MSLFRNAISSPLQELLRARLQGLSSLLAALPPGQYDEALERLLLASDYAQGWLSRRPEDFLALAQSGRLQCATATQDYQTRAQALLAQAQDEAGLMRELRLWRGQEMLRWIYRDANNLSPVPELTRELSDFADACLEVAQAFAYAALCRDHGEPVGHSGEVQRLCVIGMGKLGAQELNLSSDVDLIFAYPEGGETNGARSLSNQEFFVRLGQRIIKLLDAQTVDGFVFRVDMRLRPWGDGSALASSFTAMETYYEQHGREWERYALIKARICAGDQNQGHYLMQALKPFVFRRYIDFGAFESLREMKAMIAREVRRKGMDDNVKLGAGGIREVEFIAQAFQLIRGGVDKRLQERQLLPVLELLTEAQLLPSAVTQGLAQAYLFLRVVEHRIQMLDDQQTQMLPSGEAARARMAASLGFADWADFHAVLDRHRRFVEAQFRDVIVLREEDEPAECQTMEPVVSLWQGGGEEAEAWLRERGVVSPETVQARLAELRGSRAVAAMQAVSRERLDKLMPLLLLECLRHEEAELAIERCLPLVESVLRRSAYMMLLIENRAALERLVDLCATSPWIAAELARYPVLLDELLNAATLYTPPQKEALVAELREQLMRVPQDDLEAQMEALRIFQKGHVLRVAASDLKGSLPLMKISDYLTWIAEAVLEDVLLLAWQALVSRHGRPVRADGTPCDPDFIILGYGKLGGLELGYGSDLDLVFVHDGAADGETDGARPLDNSTFYARLGQKIIHFLTTATRAGTLYEVDMRLRPSGNSGLLVSSLAAFENYQEGSAWTWEHQALVRARVVAGDAALAEKFYAVRQRVLSRARDQAALKAEVVAMRNKMREHLSSEAPGKGEAGLFALKHDRGGIVDIEFMVQYAVLAWAHENPELTRYPDNVRILEGLANLDLLPLDAASQLKDAYLQYRARGHRLALANREAKVSDDEFQAERRLVTHWWQRLLESE